MIFDPYQDVILTADVPGQGLRVGDVGTIVERHDLPGREPGYSGEFFDMTGRTRAVICVPAGALRSPTPADRPAARTLVEAGAR
jgi:Domain of unknown function (DUF4926)